MSKSRVDRVKREVLESKLLVAIEDESGQVAVVLNLDGINRLIRLVERRPFDDEEDYELFQDLCELRRQAFGV